MTMTQSTPTKPKLKTELLFDLESTGLLRRGSTIHCIVMRNMAADGEPEVFDYQPLVLSRIFYPKIDKRDFERRPTGMPQRLYGRHSLEAWGYRLRCFKGDFGKHEGSWETYTPEMLDYCIQDTQVTVKLFELLMRRMKDYQ